MSSRQRGFLIWRTFLLQVHCKNKPIASYINWYDLGGATAGMSGAAIANVVNTAVLESIRQGKEEVNLLYTSEYSDLSAFRSIVFRGSCPQPYDG